MNIGSQHVLRIFPGLLSPTVQSTAISVGEFVTSQEAIQVCLSKLSISECSENFELVEVCYRNSVLEHESEKVLQDSDFPIQLIKDWENLTPSARTSYRLFIREKKPPDSVESKVEPLRQNWMDCHESIRTMPNFQFDLESRLDDDDLCELPNLDEGMLLKHLQERFEEGRIYTYVGEILLSVNPFRFFPIYNPKFITAYNNKNLGTLPPHIFAIADISFHRMLKEKKNQCIVISGESGSGKTESTKLIVHHLTALSRKSQATTIEKTVLGVGPVLEAFGNAKTAYNNNSSRFGKFTQIKFREDGVVSGAELRKYLLEKSRIVSQAPEERNYHVFYYLLAGAPPELKEALYLTDPQDYYYLNQSKCYTIEGIDECYEYLRLKQSMDMVGFSTDVQERIFKALSAVLHIGNIRFVQKPGDEETVEVQNIHILKIISDLLMVTEEKLIDVLTTRKQVTRGEQFIVPYKYQEALATRDAMAKALYGALFDWIVLQVNHVLVIKQQRHKEWCSIGVLDIFGFEDFLYNSFEQLCINFANEKLQYYFNQHIFRLEQDEYNSEGILWRNVEFVDNYGCIELISGRPTGIMPLIDEESSFPGATKFSLLNKINKTHSANQYYELSLINPSFMVKHYAGNVEYQITGFLDKNRDLMRPDILSILKSSNLKFIRELIGADPMAVYRWSVLRAFFKAVHAFIVSGRMFRTNGKASERTAARRRKASSKSFRMKLLNEEEQTIPYGESASLFRKASKVIRRIQSNKSASPSKNFVSKIRQGLETKRDMSMRTYDYMYKTQRGKAAPKNPPTVSAQFQSSLNRLMEILGEAQPFFVRCIRSNAEKAPLKFDCDVVQRQLRYTGMLETVRIRRLGYQWRFHLDEFVKRYSLLFPHVINDPKKEIASVLKSLKLDPNEYQIGTSKIFLRESQHRILQDNLHQVFIGKVCTIQRWTRGVLQRKHFVRQRSAAITIQAHVRGHLVRADLSHRVYSATKVQAVWRGYHAQVTYRRTVKMILIQTYVRGYLARKRYQALLLRKREEEEEEEKRKQMALLAEVKKRPRIGDIDSRRLVRSISDPSDYDKLKKTIMEDIKVPPPKTPTLKITTEDEHLEPNDFVASRVKDLSKRFERELVLFSPEDIRRRTASDPAAQRRVRSLPRPTPLTIKTERADEEKSEVPDVVKLNTVYSPTQLMELNTSTVDISCTAFPRRMTSRIRRSLSTKSKTKLGQRMSTSDIPDERPLTQYSMDDDILADLKQGSTSTETLPSLTSLSSSSGDVRKSKGRSLFRRKNRNSFRRKSEPGLAKNSVKKQEKHEKSEKNEIKQSRSTEDLLNALKQTKIVSTISKSAITSNKQLKPTDKKVARGAADLGALESFLTHKISLMNQEQNIRDTIVDRVFKKALHEFHTFLISERSLIINHGKNVSLKYEEMTSKFETILGKIIKTERIDVTFPVIMGVNAFNGVLDEYFDTRAQALVKAEKSRAPKQNLKKRKRKSDVVVHNNHKFAVAQFSIPTFCEHCNSLIWVLEKGMVCQDCRFTCHKKCHLKSTLFCVRNTQKTKMNSKRNSVFGGELSEMTSEECLIPIVVEKMVQDIEFRGLYAEGIYRKSPNAATVRALKNAIVSNGIEEVDLTAYSVHVVASVLKLFFRQLASPVFTDSVYYEFIRCSELSDEKVQLETLCALVEKLPRVNKEMFERLIFHLARIADNEESNLMHPNALSIIWAPCIMRTPSSLGPLESLQHVPKQTQCLETLIVSQVMKIRSTLSDIRVLDKAADTTTKRLSMLNLHEEEEDLVEQDLTEGNEVKSLLTQQLEALQQQRDVLTVNLTQLKPKRHKEAGDSGEDAASDDNITDDELDLEPLENNEECAVTFELPAAPAALNHLTKRRAQLQANKRLPTRSKLR
ncbi:unconventional myosin-IXa-like [Actinia tenebrosa]|uniref:Unconventional myosin-IXa-like n=1 Tax=Actinia tenebrosa TaxID=6105 RepID=A0A6P8ITX5_ACTTE|nr:unconventional myosin-IXa-like [Actinia tenebrosa]